MNGFTISTKHCPSFSPLYSEPAEELNTFFKEASSISVKCSAFANFMSIKAMVAFPKQGVIASAPTCLRTASTMSFRLAPSNRRTGIVVLSITGELNTWAVELEASTAELIRMDENCITGEFERKLNSEKTWIVATG